MNVDWFVKDSVGIVDPVILPISQSRPRLYPCVMMSCESEMGFSYDAARNIAPLRLTVKVNSIGDCKHYKPVARRSVLHPVTKVISALDRLFACTQSGIMVVPSNHSCFVYCHITIDGCPAIKKL